MIKTEEIIQKIERYASPDLAESWDNTGWQINLHHDYTNRVLIALSFTKEVLEQAITNDCDLIITHHPPIFHKLNKIDNNELIQAIKHNICVYSAHTNLDKTYGSTTDALCGVLGVKQALNSDRIKLVNPSNVQTVRNVAISAGAGGSFIESLNDYDIDLYITGDVKFHNALEAEGFAVADVGHFHSELPVLPLIQGLIAKTGVETIIAREQVPWTYI